MILTIEDANRVRTCTLNRPEALNAFNEALYDATAEALLAAADDPEVAVVLLTGAGRAFSAGTDLAEMQAYIADPDNFPGDYGTGFIALVDALTAFPKPLICAVNGLGLGIGTTILGFADLAFMADDARLKCPFTSLGVAPEAASSYLLPQLIGRQNAAWLLLSDAERHLTSSLTGLLIAASPIIAAVLDRLTGGERLGAKRIAGLAVGRRCFIHINNTNPVLIEGSPERRAMEEAGWEISHDGLEVVL